MHEIYLRKCTITLMSRLFTLILIGFLSLSFISLDFEVGQVIDRYYDVPVYYNGNNFRNVTGRHVTKDGYNLGLKYQCVEYVKRFYYEVHDHKMPNSYGHAKELFNRELEDVAFNAERGLMQYRNTRYEKPQEGDMLVYGASRDNPFGHTGIICEVGTGHVVLIQQITELRHVKDWRLQSFKEFILSQITTYWVG